MEPIHVSPVSEGVPIAQSFAQPTRNGRAVPQNSDHAVSCFHVYSSGPSCDHSEHYRRCSCARRPTGSQQLRRVRGPLTLGAKRKRSLSVSPYVDSHVNNGNITEDVGDHEYDRLRCERCSMIFKEFKRANRHRREVCSGNEEIPCDYAGCSVTFKAPRNKAFHVKTKHRLPIAAPPRATGTCRVRGKAWNT
jgi:hypothetical protein